MNPTPPIELDDVQGIVVRGYGNLPVARFVLLRVIEPRAARRWLAANVEAVTWGSTRPETRAMNVACTYGGLKTLALPDAVLVQFADEFRSGMTTRHKQRILGDKGESDPACWTWGGARNAVDVLVAFYALDDAGVAEAQEQVCGRLEAHGLREIHRVDSARLKDGKEHFGFRDGIGQPYVREFDPGGNRVRPHPVALGEFVLGYPNAYGQFTDRPLVDAALDPTDVLAPDVTGSAHRDLGRNGSYLVFRQLRQDVSRFWSFMKSMAADGANDDAVRIAAKMVGRWPSGVPLVASPDRDGPGPRDLDDFLFHDADRLGLKCPLGSHIRRANPRDALEPGPGTEKSIAFSNRHRILRRGRPYGEPLHPSMEARELIARIDTDDHERGLLFICLNASIGRQFEFVQHTWCNNPNFDGLYDDPDPLIGDRTTHGKPQNTFTIQQHPVRKRVAGLPDFVRVVGGSYFFLPGKRALRYIVSGATTT